MPGMVKIAAKEVSFLPSFLPGGLQPKKEARHNFLLRQALRCRGDWIRTSDLLNPIQQVLAPKDAKTGRISTYSSHIFHTLHA
jgi:hypothetical protein